MIKYRVYEIAGKFMVLHDTFQTRAKALNAAADIEREGERAVVRKITEEVIYRSD